MRNGNGSAPSPLLIDTHYWIWLEEGDRERMSAHNLGIIHEASSAGNLFISVISVWELGMLESKGRIQLGTNCTQWVEDALAQPGVTLAPLTPAIAIESSNLPGSFRGDPADRIIVATARALRARLLSSDKISARTPASATYHWPKSDEVHSSRRISSGFCPSVR